MVHGEAKPVKSIPDGIYFCMKNIPFEMFL